MSVPMDSIISSVQSQTPYGFYCQLLKGEKKLKNNNNSKDEEGKNAVVTLWSNLQTLNSSDPKILAYRNYVLVRRGIDHAWATWNNFNSNQDSVKNDVNNLIKKIEGNEKLLKSYTETIDGIEELQDKNKEMLKEFLNEQTRLNKKIKEMSKKVPSNRFWKISVISAIFTFAVLNFK